MEIRVKKIIVKKYTGTKTICAAPMTKADAEKLLGISISPATPGNDGYLVEYPDGYRSWSPKKVFEAAYRVSETPVDRMKNELFDLTERICKGVKKLYGCDTLTPTERWKLHCQLQKMDEYALALSDRIHDALNPCEAANLRGQDGIESKSTASE